MLTLHKAIDLFLGEYIPTTRRSYEFVLVSMRDFVGPNRPLDTVLPEYLIEYVQSVNNRPDVHSPATVNKYIKTLRTFFNWCVKVQFIEKSPAIGLKYHRQSKTIDRSKAMPDDSYAILLELARWQPRAHALALYLGDTGGRIGGAANLRWESVELEKRRATVIEKGNKPRPVFFGPECVKALARWKFHQALANSEAYVFSKKGEAITSASLRQFFRRLCQRAGIGSWGPHSLRHRKGYQLSDNQVSPTLAAQLFGHENVETTLNYYYPDDWDRVQEVAQKFTAQSKSSEEKIINFQRRSEGS